MEKTTQKILFFVSAGIGDSVLLVPLLNKLNDKLEANTTVFLNSPFLDIGFLESIGFPVDRIVQISSKQIFKYILSNINYFDIAYLDFSSSSVKNLILATLISKKVKYMRKNKLLLPKSVFVSPKQNIHAAVLNMKLFDANYGEKDFKLEDIRLFSNIVDSEVSKRIKESGNTIISVQISAANLSIKYKNWPIEYWIEFFDLVYSKYKDIYFILLGDANEIHLGLEILKETQSKNIISYIGKTTLSQAVAILKSSDLYVGLDSGFMHLAVAFGIPTFTIFGASSEDMYGYQKFDPGQHNVVHLELACRSCHAWIGNNTSRVDDPIKCPDLVCLTNLKPEAVFAKFASFFKHNIS